MDEFESAPNIQQIIHTVNRVLRHDITITTACLFEEISRLPDSLSVYNFLLDVTYRVHRAAIPVYGNNKYYRENLILWKRVLKRAKQIDTTIMDLKRFIRKRRLIVIIVILYSVSLFYRFSVSRNLTVFPNSCGNK